MAKLKTELTAAINPFRGYIQGAEVSDRNGILLSGPPGNGKTAFAMAIAGELELPFVKVMAWTSPANGSTSRLPCSKSCFDKPASRPA